MNHPAVLVLLLEQGDRSLEDHTEDFVFLTNLTHYLDSCLCSTDMPVLLPPSSELSSYPELSTCLATCSSYHPCHFSSATAASWQPLSPPSVRWDRRGSASLHRRRGWRIPCLCLQPLSLRLRLGPSTQRLTSAPSSLVSTVTRRPTSSTGLPLPSGSALVGRCPAIISGLRSSGCALTLHPTGSGQPFTITFLCGARSRLPGGWRSVTPQDCFHSPCALWPSFCLSLIVSLCSGVSSCYPHLRSPYTVSCIQFCVSLSGLVYVCVCLLPSYDGLPLCGLLKTVYTIFFFFSVRSLLHHTVTILHNSGNTLV